MSPGRWSDYVYYSPNADAVYSMVKFIEDGTKVTATAYGINEDITKLDYRMVVYGADGNVKEIIPMTARGNVYSATSDVTEEDTVKVMLWTKESYIPVTTSATYGANDTAVGNILVDGKPLDGFSANKYEYNVTIPYGTTVFPVIKASARDNTSKVGVDHDYNNLRTYITVTAPDGESKKTVVNYVLENEGIHLIKGASDEADFVNDSGRKDAGGTYSGKVSSQKVVDFSYTIEHNAKYKDASGKVITPSETVTTDFASMLNVYTNVAPNRGGNNFGSKVVSDRAPNTHNHSEFNSPNKSYLGYDHILAPNDDFFRLKNAYADGSIKNVKLNFGIDDSAEVVVLSNDDIPALRIGGFKKDIMETVSKGRYINAPGPEDWYYNIAFNGFTESDFTQNNNMPVNYDVLERMIDVAPLNGYTNYSQYKEASPSKESFAIGNTKYAVDNVYVYDNVFTKRFEEAGNVELDFGSFTSTPPRFMVIVRPLTPQKPVADFKVTAPKAFEEVDSKLLEGTNDSLETHTSHKLYTENGVGRNLNMGTYFQQENTSGNTVSMINEFLGIEGGLIIPIQSSVDSAREENNWMRAYYYGTGSISGFSYPAMKDKVNDWYEFTLNRSADVYVIASGNKPGFIDDTWQQLNFPGNAFLPMGATVSYDKVYVKHIDVEIGEPVTVSMKTQGIGKLGAQYFTVVKPVE